MRSVVFALLTLAVCFPAGAKRKEGKNPDIRILSAAARRLDGTITLDGRVQNSGEKPIQGLVLVFHFMAPGRAVITSQKSPIDEESLAPGEESAFHFQLDDPVRAVRYEINAVDDGGRELRVDKSGPFVIE